MRKRGWRRRLPVLPPRKDYHDMWRHFLACLRGECKPGPTWRPCAEISPISTAAYRSIASGKMEIPEGIP